MARKTKGIRSNGKHLPQELPPRYQPGFLGGLDARTAVARELRRRYCAIASDLGGETELSHMQRALVERAVFLEAVLQDMEAQIATARQVGTSDAAKLVTDLIGKWTQATNAFVGLCVRLGLRRNAMDAFDNFYRQQQPVTVEANGAQAANCNGEQNGGSDEQ